MLKTLYEKRIKQITKIFLLCRQGFQTLFLQGVNPFPNNPWFLIVCSTDLLKTQWEKKKLLFTSNFSFSRSVFYPFGEHSATFIKLKIAVFKLFLFGSI